VEGSGRNIVYDRSIEAEFYSGTDEKLENPHPGLRVPSPRY
jgi:hypothetical protein